MSIYGHKGPMCPHCGHEHDAVDNDAFDEDMSEFQCGWCDKVFKCRYRRTDVWISERDNKEPN